jgi:hypothetical protein
MVAETFAQSMRAFARRRPFKPFFVELVSGDRIFIEHPEAVAFRGGAAVFISPGGEYALFDHESVSQLVDQMTEPSNS